MNKIELLNHLLTNNSIFNWILKFFIKPKPIKIKKINPKIPCWRCNQTFKSGPHTPHKCPHGDSCVMLGWRCVTCRGDTSVRLGLRECLHPWCNEVCKVKNDLK